MATRTARSVDRTVDKMLRQMAQSSKAAAGSSASSSTAAQALEQMAQIQKRIARGDTDAAQFLIERATASQDMADDSSVDALRQSMRAAKKQKATSDQAANSSKQRLFIGAGVVVACLLAVVFAVGGFQVLVIPSRARFTLINSLPLIWKWFFIPFNNPTCVLSSAPMQTARS